MTLHLKKCQQVLLRYHKSVLAQSREKQYILQILYRNMVPQHISRGISTLRISHGIWELIWLTLMAGIFKILTRRYRFYEITFIWECISSKALAPEMGTHFLFSWFPFYICNTHALSSAWELLMGDDFRIDLPFSQTKGTKGWAISPRLAAFGPERGEILGKWRASMADLNHEE